MRVLALDTTTRAGSVAVLDDGRLLAACQGDGTRTHAERLPGEIVQVLAAASLTTGDIDLFAVAAGPGSFTGLRIGIAAVQGLATVHKRPVAPISVLRALAEAAAEQRPAGVRVGAWMDGRRHEVFTALYDIVEPATQGHAAVLAEVEDARVGRPAATLARWVELEAPAVICGDGAVLYADLVSAHAQVLAPPPLAAAIGRLARAATAGAPAAVQPLYVRRTDVELARDASTPRR